jgi:hypothetical protein
MYMVREYDNDLQFCEYIVDKLTEVHHKKDAMYIVREVKQASDGLHEYGDIIDTYTYN